MGSKLGYRARVKARPKALILLGAALMAPAAILWAHGAIQGPRPLYISEDTYWVGLWLLVAVPVAALTGVVLIIVGGVLTFLNRKSVP